VVLTVTTVASLWKARRMESSEFLQEIPRQPSQSAAGGGSPAAALPQDRPADAGREEGGPAPGGAPGAS